MAQHTDVMASVQALLEQKKTAIEEHATAHAAAAAANARVAETYAGAVAAGWTADELRALNLSVADSSKPAGTRRRRARTPAAVAASRQPSSPPAAPQPPAPDSGGEDPDGGGGDD